ncbi:succinylglutamate desuccinylase/aspartoacylase family protein [Myxococcota bacterium]|nr:succinylglutamate desuccinylase/aspartoacylase family protein [Myxococcota bacterium]
MIPIIERLDPKGMMRGTIAHLKLSLVGDARGERIYIPLLVARGAHPGPTLGLTAAIHGNELNGLRVIHRLFEELNPQDLRGDIIAAPIVNVPGFLQSTRAFNDGQDLNRIMPGRPNGNSAEVYAYRFIERVLSRFDYLVDLHTASFGRINSLYVRADLDHPETSWMARAQHPQIILHNTGSDGTLRSAAMDRGIPAITVEVGNPMRFQRELIRYGFVGVANILARLKMVDLEEALPSFEPVICRRSSWMYTDLGGLLQVYPELCDRVEAGAIIARVSDVYGQALKTYRAPEAGIVIGKSTNPASQTGSRIIHLGVVTEESVEDLAEPL